MGEPRRLPRRSPRNRRHRRNDLHHVRGRRTVHRPSIAAPATGKVGNAGGAAEAIVASGARMRGRGDLTTGPLSVGLCQMRITEVDDVQASRVERLEGGR